MQPEAVLIGSTDHSVPLHVDMPSVENVVLFK